MTDFDPQSADSFFKRLEPALHFKKDETAVGGYRITSAAFKEGERIDDFKWRNSVDWGALTDLEAERDLRDRQHPGRGIGEFKFSHIDGDAQFRVRHSPSYEDPVNPGHCDLDVRDERAAKHLARSCEVVEWPQNPIPS